MDKTNFARRIVAFFMSWLIVFNCGDVGLLKGIVHLQATVADDDTQSDTEYNHEVVELDASERERLWVEQKQELSEWFKNTEAYSEITTTKNDQTPKTNVLDGINNKVNNKANNYKGFWKDTSNLEVVRINEEEVIESTTDNITESTTITEDDIESTTSETDKSLGVRITKYSYSDIAKDGKAVIKDGTIGEYNATGGNVYNGADNVDTTGLYYTVEHSDSYGGDYRRYYVSTARQLAAVLKSYDFTRGDFELYLKAKENEIDDGDAPVNKIGIVLLCDIDLGGAYSKNWVAYVNKNTDSEKGVTNVWLEIDGNGHTVYNLRSNAFLNSDYRFSVHDITFSNIYYTGAHGTFGAAKYAYFDNVNWKDCLAIADKASISIVFNSGYLDCYLKNCNISNSYIKGNGDGHCGFFASFNGNIASSGTYIDSNAITSSSYYYTNVPELEEAERTWFATGNQQKNSKKYGKLLSKEYPSIYENCSVTDSNIYEMSDNAYHSGVFVSCMQGNIIFKNCYTNGSIYGYQQLGAFIGGVIGSLNGFNYPNPDNENKSILVNAYFENCYASGSAEGNKKLGGFAGMVYDDYRATGDEIFDPAVKKYYYNTAQDATSATESKTSNKRGKVIFKNCYTTASVGMEYSGKEIGGFVGVMRGNVQGTGDAKKHLFINCYAAGEVGGIGTNNSDTDENTNSIGGFIGVYRPADYSDYTTSDGKIKGIMTNCYYDKQTTAMREREVGSYNKKQLNIKYGFILEDNTTCYKYEEILDDAMSDDNYNLCNTLSGLYGVYTQQSESQGVEGLTDSVRFKNSDAWVYVKGYYPQLSVFYNANDGSADFGSAKKAEQARLYSRASAATVFLEHWDEIMSKEAGMKGEMTVEGADKVYDTVRDISAKFSFTSDGNIEPEKDTDGYLGWQLNTKRNEKSNFSEYLGSEKSTMVVENNFQGVASTDSDGESESTTESDTDFVSTFSNVEISGFTVPFTNTEGETILNKYYSPKVLQIGAEKEDNDKYSFKCFDYAAGKQFVKVITCNKADYKAWQSDQQKYDQYLIDNESYEVERANMIEHVEQVSNDELTDEYINYYYYCELAKLVKGVKDDDFEQNYKNMSKKTQKAFYDKVRTKAESAYDAAQKYIANNSEANKELVEDCLIFDTSAWENLDGESLEVAFHTSVSEKKSAIAKYIDVDNDDKGFPLTEAVNNATHDPEDFEHYVSGNSGTRTFRLIPQSYLNAGDMIRINVLEDDTDNNDSETADDNESVADTTDTTNTTDAASDDTDTVTSTDDSDVQNSITLVTDDGNISLDRFDHTIGVTYVSTQGMPLWDCSDGTEYDESEPTLWSRLSDKTAYEGQLVCKRDEFLDSDGKFFDVAKTKSVGYFALYSYYPSYQKTENLTQGLDGELINKRSIGTFYPNGYVTKMDAEEKMGKTMVRVYTTKPKYTDEAKTSFTLVKDKQIDMQNPENLAKWSGNAKFRSSDKGYYFMTYYWRLNDGRYRSEDKLVVIETNKYNVKMLTGVADATEDTFISKDSPSSTAIDCDIISGTPGDEEMRSYNFPSDNFVAENKDKNPTWDDWYKYANDVYDGGVYGDTTVYPENDGTKYWSKCVTQTTGAGNMTVAWRKSADYRLDKLVVRLRRYNSETDTFGDWENMSVIKFDSAGKASLENSNITYSYKYSSYAVSQNSRTKAFSVIRTDNTIREFAVENDINETKNSVVQFINFNFVDSNVGQSIVQLNDDVMVMALFSRITASVDVDKYVLIDDGNDEESEVKLASTASKSLATVDSYRSVDNAKFGDDDKRAVLFGDTLIYRLKLQNTGVYNANNVVVTDKIPNGCTLLPSSVKVYRQRKVYSDPAENYYLNLENMNVNKVEKIGDGVYDEYANDKCLYENVDNTLTFMLNPVNREYDYYLQYKVTVDADYQADKETLYNTASYTYAFINGGSSENSVVTDDGEDAEDSDPYNESYPKNAVFNVTSSDKGNTYTLNFKAQADNANNYEIVSITNRYPSGYVLDESAKFIISGDYDIDDVDVDTTSSTAEFTITPKGTLTFNKDQSIQITFTVKPTGAEDTYANDPTIKRSNYSAITYQMANATETDGTRAWKNNAITKVDADTNTVETAVRWLYLNVEKQIPIEDSSQAFLFKLVNNTIGKTVFTDVYETDKTEMTSKSDDENAETKTTVYKGNNLIQITKRGEYSLSETDWANTDYDVDSAEYSFEDIVSEDESLMQDDITEKNGVVTMYLPRAMYDSTAFPLWAVDSGEDDIVYPTVTCTNTASKYAYLTSQQNVTNSFIVDGAVTPTSSARTSARRSVPRDTTTSPQAVLNTAVLELKEEDDNDE